MFELINEKTRKTFEAHQNRLKEFCVQDANISELVGYVIAYSDQESYSGGGDENSLIGSHICSFIWQISGVDIGNISNPSNFDVNWARDLASFIGNYILYDSCFDFEVDEYDNVIRFQESYTRNLQDPRILIEAAKAMSKHYQKLDNAKSFSEAHGIKADISKVLELVKAIEAETDEDEGE